MAIMNSKENKGLKECRVYTPKILVEIIKYIIDTSKLNPKVILEPSIGEGDLIKPFKNNTKIIGVDIDEKGKNHCDTFYHTDFEKLELDKKLENVEAIISNPPFNGHPSRKLYPEVFLRKAIELFGKDIPIIMIVPHGVRFNQKINSSRMKWMAENINITSTITLPLDIFPNVAFHTEILFINIPNLKPHYYFNNVVEEIEKNKIQKNMNIDIEEEVQISNEENLPSKSVLELVEKNIDNKEVDFMESGFTKLQNQATKRGIKLIEEELIKKPYLSCLAYTNICLISYSKDKNLFDKIDNFSDIEYLDFLKNKDNQLINVKSFNDVGDYNRLPLFVYAGGKQNHKSTQQSIVASMLLKSPQINSYYEPFAGGLGSVYNSLPILIENGIKNIFISDVNHSLINVYRQVQRNHKSVQRELAKIELDFFGEYGKLFADSKEELKDFFTKKQIELNELEKKNRMNAKRAALFLYLMNICQGGMNNFDMETKTNKFSCAYDGNKHKKIAFIINKVEIYHQIFKLANFEFRVKRYQSVLKKVKNDNTAFVLLDPEYVEFGEEIIKSCKHTYTNEGRGFNHKEVLNLLNNGKYPFIYYNNHHSFIENIAIKNDYVYVKKDVEYINGNKPKSSIEILMYGRYEQPLQVINNTNYISKLENVA